MACFKGHLRPHLKGRRPSASQILGSPSIMPTPFDVERPNSVWWRTGVLGGRPRPPSPGEYGPAFTNFWGSPTYAYGRWCRTTKFSVVAHSVGNNLNQTIYKLQLKSLSMIYGFRCLLLWCEDRVTKQHRCDVIICLPRRKNEQFRCRLCV